MGILQQQTLASAVGCTGVGLHSGDPIKMTLRPARPGSGIIFRRLDAGAEIPARWDHAIEASLATVLSNGEGIRIGTIEHLMAALAGCEVDNAVIEIDGPEVPIMDGSAAPFVRLIERAGVEVQDAARRAIKILKPVSVDEGEASVALLPDHGFAMSFEIDFSNPLIRRQDLQLVFEPGTFETELSRARSFCLYDDLDRMRASGLARGGSLENAIVVRGTRILNTDGLRFADEFVRHKLLDAFGDLYLAGGPIVGQFVGTRSGHALTRRLLATLFADPDAWCETTIAEPAGIEAVAWPEARRAVAA